MLRNKAKSAVLWSAVDTFVRHGMGFVISVILARLLAPEDFRTLALLALFIRVATLFVNAGFSSALIQRRDITHLDESTVFWFNLAAGIVMALVLGVISPWIADVFRLPVLQPLTVMLACALLVSAIGSVHGALLTRRLDFKTPMKIGAVSTLLSGSVGIYAAVEGYGVWALGWQVLTSAVVSTALLWFFCAWRPLWTFSRVSFQRLFSFGGWLFAAHLLDTVYQRGYTLLIGKFYGTHALGIYNRADNTQQLPSMILTDVLSRVAFPLFSSLQADKHSLRRGVRASVRGVMLVIAPAMVGLAVLAEPFIEVVFGEQWLPAAPILQVLCAVGFFWPLQVIHLNVLQAQGHGRLFFRLAIIKKVLGVVLLVGGAFFGVMGIAWSRVVHSVIALAINTHYSRKFLGYGVRDQVGDCLPSILTSGAMAAVVGIASASASVESNGVMGLFLLIVLGASFYLASNAALGVSAFKESIAFMKGRV